MNLSILHIRAFRNLWLGQVISQAGDAFYYVSFMFMVRELTGSSLMVGLVGAAETLPYLLFGPFAGVVADRIDRRKIMLLSDVVSGLVLMAFSLPFVMGKHPWGWVILAVAFVLSSVRVFFYPAKSAAIPMLVPADRVMEANAFSQMSQSSLQLVSLGLSAGALSLLYAFSHQWFYFGVICLNAISFFGSAAFIRLLPKVAPRSDAEVAAAHPMADFKDGISFIHSRRDLSVLIALLAMFRFGVAPFFVVYTESNKQWFDGRPQNLAWFEFSFVLGMVLGSVVMGKMKTKHPTRWFAAGLGVVGLSVGAMAIYHTLLGFVLANLVAGVACMAADLPLATYMQLSIPNEFQGRVNGVLNTIATGTMPLANVIMGLFIVQIGLFWGYMAMGIVMTLACVIGMLDRAYRDALMPDTTVIERIESTDSIELAGA